MGKYAVHRLDANHREIRAALEKVGATVITAGPADLLAGFRGATFILEIKTSRGALNAHQQHFQAWWKGQFAVVRTVDDALKAIGAISDQEGAVAH